MEPDPQSSQTAWKEEKPAAEQEPKKEKKG